MKKGSYQKGELVLVADEALKNQAGKKGSLRWFSPYAIVLQRMSGAFVLQELDGTVLKQPVAWKRLKSYVPRKGLEPVVLKSKWLSDVSGQTEEFGEWESLKEREAALTKANRDPILGLLRPWELKGKDLVEYWSGVKE